VRGSSLESRLQPVRGHKTGWSQNSNTEARPGTCRRNHFGRDDARQVGQVAGPEAAALAEEGLAEVAYSTIPMFRTRAVLSEFQSMIRPAEPPVSNRKLMY
jgi:hypothetical protein